LHWMLDDTYRAMSLHLQQYTPVRALLATLFRTIKHKLSLYNTSGAYI